MNFDSAFIKKLKAQDTYTFNTFYLETVDIFYRYLQNNYSITQQDMEDIVADFYVRFRESLHRFDEAQSFTGYMWTIFKNLVKDFFKKNTDIPFTHLDSGEEDGSTFGESLVDEADILDLFEAEAHLDCIEQAMKELDDVSKDLIYRKYIEQKPQDEIQFLLGISADNLRQKLSRAIKQLKQHLQQTD